MSFVVVRAVGRQSSDLGTSGAAAGALLANYELLVSQFELMAGTPEVMNEWAESDGMALHAEHGDALARGSALAARFEAAQVPVPPPRAAPPRPLLSPSCRRRAVVRCRARRWIGLARAVGGGGWSATQKTRG